MFTIADDGAFVLTSIDRLTLILIGCERFKHKMAFRRLQIASLMRMEPTRGPQNCCNNSHFMLFWIQFETIFPSLETVWRPLWSEDCWKKTHRQWPCTWRYNSDDTNSKRYYLQSSVLYVISMLWWHNVEDCIVKLEWYKLKKILHTNLNII